MVPGFACAPNVWFKVHEPLSRSFQLHLVTVPGFGGTPRIEPPVSPKVRDALSDYCSGLEGAVLLGHSYGAFLALWTAARSSDAVSVLIAVDGLPYFPTVWDLGATPESLRDRAEQERNKMAAGPPQPKPGETYFDQNIIDPKDAAYMNETTPKSDPVAMGDIRYEILTTDIRAEMSNIRVPTLFIAAGQPWVKKPEDVQGVENFYRERMGDIEGAELVVAERSRHFVMIDDPDFFVGTLERLATRKAKHL